MSSRGFLLDSHVMLWSLDAPHKLRPATRKVIASGESLLFFSIASLWEMTIKASLGKMMAIDNAFLSVLQRQRIRILDINISHIHALGNLPLMHRDPFDRMLVAQSMVEGLTLITQDRQLAAYGIKTLAA